MLRKIASGMKVKSGSRENSRQSCLLQMRTFQCLRLTQIKLKKECNQTTTLMYWKQEGSVLNSNKVETLTIDATMSTVGPAPLLRGTIALYMHHVERVDVEPLALQGRDMRYVEVRRCKGGDRAC